MYAGIAVLVASFAALLWARYDATTNAESDLADDAAYMADELGRDDAGGRALVEPVDGDLRAILDDFLGRIADARDVDRVVLLSRSGVVTYSTDHALIGTRSPSGRGLMDASVPVRWLLDPGRPYGTLVASRTTTNVAAAIRRDALTHAGTVVLALLALYLALIPVFRNVTRALAEREAKYRALMEEASDGIFVADRTGRLVDVNESACTMLGYSRDELLALRAQDLMSAEDVAQLPLRFAELESGMTLLVERPVRRKDGTFLTGDVHARMLEDGRLYAAIRDVSERKRLERELRHAYKLEAVNRFAGGFAEDLDRLLAEVQRASDASDIQSTLARARALTSQLLAVGSKHPVNAELLDVNVALELMRELLDGLTGEGIELVVNYGAAAAGVHADPDLLQKLVVDLVLHARTEMPNGGTITIETSNIDFARDGRSSRGGRHVMLSVSDTSARGGANDEGGERLGLGLAAIYGIVHQSGGSIGVETEPGVGTTVRIYLPSAELPALSA